MSIFHVIKNASFLLYIIFDRHYPRWYLEREKNIMKAGLFTFYISGFFKVFGLY